MVSERNLGVCHSEHSEESRFSVCHSERSEESRFIKPTDIMKALEKENIESRPIWKPMHMQPFFAEYDCIGGNVAENLFNNGICLPSDTKMTDGDLDRVVTSVKQLFKR